MTTTTENKSCLACNRPIKGRTDKRFCDDHCRSNWHNHSRPPATLLVKSINRQLLRNRAILMQLLTEPSGRAVVSKAILEMLGFAFNVHTHTYTNKKGNTYYYTYEVGYLTLSQGRCLLLRTQEEI